MNITRKAYAKINLGLDVLRRRADGYHDVKMVMQTVNIYDELTFEKNQTGEIRITIEGAGLPVDRSNLIYRAAELMQQTYGLSDGITISLKKQIPIAAGMAGGSTDAAAVFHGMNELFVLQASIPELQKLGVQIGADVPYCILGGTALSEGIGERLTSLPAAPGCYLVVAKPDIAVSTKFVYENLHADNLQSHPDIDGMVQAIIQGDLQGITTRMENVLETVTIEAYPVIRQIKEQMQQLGVEKALMSGSGPTVFGIWSEEEVAERAFQVLQKAGLAKQIFLTTFVN